MKDSDEFSFLKKTFKSLGNQYFDSSGILVGPGDDAGLVKNSKETIYSVDASVAGVHFPKNLNPENIAYRALSTAASDIAACGGALKWILVSLTIEQSDSDWLSGFVAGLKSFSDTYHCPILGGDLSIGKEVNIAVTVGGELKGKKFISRDGARVNDIIFLTGKIGMAKIGLDLIQKDLDAIDLSSENVNKFLLPKLSFDFAQEISDYANSCIDISDGLLADLGHICTASKVGAKLELKDIPYVGKLEEAMTWGDDYELCFTTAAVNRDKIHNIAKTFRMDISEIGEITSDKEVKVYKNGSLVTFDKRGYNHFNE